MGSLSDIQAGARDREYAQKQMWLIHCARAERLGKPLPEPPPCVKDRNEYKRNAAKEITVCADCDEEFEIKRFTLTTAVRLKRKVRCPPCRKAHITKQARERARRIRRGSDNRQS